MYCKSIFILSFEWKSLLFCVLSIPLWIACLRFVSCRIFSDSQTHKYFVDHSICKTSYWSNCPDIIVHVILQNLHYDPTFIPSDGKSSFVFISIQIKYNRERRINLHWEDYFVNSFCGWFEICEYTNIRIFPFKIGFIENLQFIFRNHISSRLSFFLPVWTILI